MRNKGNSLKSTTENAGSGFFRILDDELLRESVIFFSKAFNRILMEKSRLDKAVVVNETSFGCDVVYGNFDSTFGISID